MTYRTIYNIALSLCDETSSEEYEAKTPNILTILQYECGAVDSVPATLVNSLDDTCLASDAMALTVIPYGLAAHLMVDDNPERASFYQQRYEEGRRKSRATPQAITDVYNLSGGV